MHYTPEQFTALAIAFALAAVRLLTASKPFWTSTPLARYATLFGPALIASFAAVPAALSGAKTWTDVAVAVLTVLSIGFAAAHGKKDAQPPAGGESEAGPTGVPLSVRPQGGMDAELRGGWKQSAWRIDRIKARLVLAWVSFASFALVALAAVACREVRPCSAEDLVSGPLAVSNTRCAVERQAKFPNLPDDACDATPGCAAILAKCDAFAEDRCR